MSADRLDRLLALCRSRVPDLRFAVKSDSAGMRALARLVRPLSPEFAERYVTVIGATVWLPRPAAQFARDDLAAILAHELVHQLDQQRYGPLFYLSYGLALPAGRTARAAWERKAYAVDLLIAREEGGLAGVRACANRLIPLFAGSEYGFMWAGEHAAARFLAPTVEAVLRGELDGRAPYAAILAAWRG